MSDELRNDPEFKAWEAGVHENLVPNLKKSSITISLAPNGEPDVKYAVELGLSIMMDKPIVIICEPGQQIPGKLRRVADQVIEVDWRNDPQAATEAVGKILDELNG